MTKTISLAEFKNLLRARVTEADSLRQCAKALGVSPAHLSHVLTHPAEMPGPRLMAKLGYRVVPMFQRIA